MDAVVYGGRTSTWGHGKYKALVDGAENEVVIGKAFLVQDREQEDTLCFFETDVYEVVRCSIGMRGKSIGDGKGNDKKERITGLCFRFCGEEALLD